MIKKFFNYNFSNFQDEDTNQELYYSRSDTKRIEISVNKYDGLLNLQKEIMN